MADNGYIHFLQAGHGDAFILYCRKGDERGIIVVDGGHATTAKHNQFMAEIEEIGDIDLMVLTHPDDDHLMGIKKYFENHKKDEILHIKEIWANCAANIEINISDDASPKGAKSLSEILSTLVDDGKIVWEKDITKSYVRSLPFADIVVISPSSCILHDFIERYREKIGYYNAPEGSDASTDRDKDYELSMKDLAARDKRKADLEKYDDASNASSISFILRCDDFSILMLGDSFPDSIIDGLKAQGYSADNKLRIDFVKVAHHGSAANISNELLAMLDCDNFIISTNGNRYKHPDREAIANILCHPNRRYERPINLYFNYPLEKLESPKPHIFNKELDSELNFATHSVSNATDEKLRIGR